MTITPPLLAAIVQRLRDPSKPKLNQSQIADHMGLSKAWASKLMAGRIGNLTDDQGRKLEDFLGIKLRPHMQEGASVSPLAARLSAKMQENTPLSDLVAALLSLVEAPAAPTGPRWIETQDMTKIGQEIITIAFANEDKPGKVARLVLELLA
jgi:transcriptional regulator with XRE-family HTH domain